MCLSWVRVSRRDQIGDALIVGARIKARSDGCPYVSRSEMLDDRSRLIDPEMIDPEMIDPEMIDPR